MINYLDIIIIYYQVYEHQKAFVEFLERPSPSDDSVCKPPESKRPKTDEASGPSGGSSSSTSPQITEPSVESSSKTTDS